MKIEGFERFHEAVAQYADRYRSDEAVRARIAGGDTSDLGIDVPEGMEVRISEQTDDTYYFVLPPNPGKVLADDDLDNIAGGTSCVTLVGSCTPLLSQSPALTGGGRGRLGDFT